MNTIAPENSKDCCSRILKAPAQYKRFSFVILFLLLFYTATGRKERNQDFDYLVFSQRWLPSSCIDYVEHSSSHSIWCTLPKNYEFWAVHGLWPTQNNHMGPFFCNKNLTFEESKIQPIKLELVSFWPNIQGGQTSSSLWQHEWEKHGTCAAQLQSLDNELKYFNTTIGFFKSHNLNNLFKKHHITPSTSSALKIDDIFQVIKSSFGKLPQINCIHEKITNQPYLAEIRLCYSKNLQLMDCGPMHGNKGLTNCPDNTKIVYPDSINPKQSQNVSGKKDFNALLNMLHLLRFLMWASI